LSKEAGTAQDGLNSGMLKLCYKNWIKSKPNPLEWTVMANIEDTGKVWFKGTFGPEYAVRVGDKVFVPGKGENDTVECRVVDNALWVDLHDKKAGKRVGRRFPLDLPTTTPATLFNGFEKTQHADVRVVTYQDEGVEEVAISGDVYHNQSIASMGPEDFSRWLTDNQGSND